MTISYKESYYYKEVERLKKRIKEIFGLKCMICQSVKNLQLHHKYLVPDSIPGKDNENGWATVKRKREAVDHPERFSLICLSCHNSIEPRRLGYRKKTAMDKRRLKANG
ncbi:MAG: hypothetical protein O6761_05820 [Thaumarchaeota archaeon]|nr:hypothetical protein [Nitrososphaerota archaeon]